MKFLINRASKYRSEEPPIEEAYEDGAICRFHEPNFDLSGPETAFYIEVKSLAQLITIIDREGSIVIRPVPEPEDRYVRPYGSQASYEITIYDNYTE